MFCVKDDSLTKSGYIFNGIIDNCEIKFWDNCLEFIGDSTVAFYK